ncbi:ribonuclease H-like domain-containing protein [Clostridium tetani]|uniref:ribonuclease H-like domain-containing protein n=1 Tax=Clostridium tetani TaxID=1513 RepID=UPI0029537D14|nr:ribonuclease H-like domain-containing protein [Clostridium tetani]
MGNIRGVNKVIINTKKEDIKIPLDIFKRYYMDEIAYFDIETTGFDRENNNIILISLGWYEDYHNFIIKQYYAESLQEEYDILKSFGEDIKDFHVWSSYNGIAFDEPFIKHRFDKKNLEYHLPEKHVDLYRHIKPYYKKLGMKRCNLKSVERFIGVNRKDEINGGISVKLYEEYLNTGDKKLRDIIMLHNYEDVLNLPKIFKLRYKIETSDDLEREDIITERQYKYLRYLLKQNDISIKFNVRKVSKRTASKLIGKLLKGTKDEEELKRIVKESY